MNEQNSTGGGWICLHRELLDKPIWTNSTMEQRIIFITLLCMANHKPNKWEFNGKPYEVQAGQFITSLQNIVKKCNCKQVTIKKVRTALERFEMLGFLTSKATNRNRLITIVNWRFYQDKTFSDGKQNDKLRASKRQAEDKLRATNNNDNNVNNVNNENNIVVGAGAEALVKKTKKFVPPTFEQVQTYCYEINSTIDPQAFIDYYVANGWKVGKNPMREWKAAVRTWDRNNVVRSRSKTKRETNVSIFVDAATEFSPSQNRGDDLIDI